MKNKKPIKVLNISAYASDLAEKKGDIFSGAQERQIDYAGLMDLYIIIAPGKKMKPAVKLSKNLIVYTVKANNTYEFLLKALPAADRIIKEHNITIITADNPFSSGPLACLLKLKHKKPLIISSMADMIDNPYFIAENKLNYLKNLIAKSAVKFADIIRVSTNAEVEAMNKRGYKNAFNAPFYIDFETFESTKENANLRKELLKDNFSNIVLYIGRFAEQKDLPTYLKAIKKTIWEYPETLFVFIGYGPLYEEVKKKAIVDGLAKNTLFLGKIPYEKIPEYYKAADIFCAASIYEGTCMTLHEAAISGLPVVATAFAGAQDLVKNGENGYLSEIGDDLGISANIKKLLAEQDSRIIMGKANKEIIKSSFSKEKALEKHKKMYEKVLLDF